MNVPHLPHKTDLKMQSGVDGDGCFVKLLRSINFVPPEVLHIKYAATAMGLSLQKNGTPMLETTNQPTGQWFQLHSHGPTAKDLYSPDQYLDVPQDSWLMTHDWFDMSLFSSWFFHVFSHLGCTS